VGNRGSGIPEPILRPVEIVAFRVQLVNLANIAAYVVARIVFVLLPPPLFREDQRTQIRMRMEGTTPKELSPHEIAPTATIQRRWRLSLWGSTVIMVRHADIVNAGSDPGLSPAGLVRATLLAHMLQDAGLSAVFVTQSLRSVQTGTPAAAGVGLTVTPYTATDTAGLVTAIRTSHANKTVLVIAHSNTVDDIAAGLGAPGVGELTAPQFDRMFVITRTWCGTRICRMRYGDATP